MNNAFGLIVYFAFLRENSFPPHSPSRWFLSTVVTIDIFCKHNY